MKLRLVIADDHEIVRHGIRMIIESEADMEVVAEAACAREALAMITAQKPDIAVLDINLPDQNGFDLLQEIRRKQPHLPVMFLTIHPEEIFAMRALQAGAQGYLCKDSSSDELVKALRKLATGGVYVSTALSEILARQVSGQREKLPHERLSDREYQVLCLLASGKSVGQIAEALDRSPNTISTLRKRILDKMSMANNSELASYAINNQLV
jgi:two-component system invasion response regulator UvrY